MSFSLALTGATVEMSRGGAVVASFPAGAFTAEAQPNSTTGVFLTPGLTGVDWSKCTSPTAANRGAWITAVHTLARPPDLAVSGDLTVAGELTVAGNASFAADAAFNGTVTPASLYQLFSFGLSAVEVLAHTVIAPIGSISATLHDMTGTTWTVSIPTVESGYTYWVECFGSINISQGGSSSTQTFVAKVTTPDTATTVLRDVRTQLVDTVAGNDAESTSMSFVYPCTQTGSHSFFWAAYGTWAPFGVDVNRCVLPYRLILRKNSASTTSTSTVS